MRLDHDFLQRILPDMRYEGHPVGLEGVWRVDSRAVGAGDIFVALPGEQHDGHNFVADAFARGAHACVVKADRWKHIQPAVRDYMKHGMCIIVEDPLEALIAWATAWRSYFSCPVIGVTGSVGKTTTKEYIAHIFRAHSTCLASEGNQNTILGAALNVLQLREHHAYAVFEMGINRHGEMKELVKLIQPTTGVITALGHTHMEGLGSLADIAAEKRLIFSELQSDGVGFINGDHPLLAQVAYTHPVIKFGLRMANQIQARQIHYGHHEISCTFKLYRERHHVVLPAENSARVYHALAATAVAHYLGVPSSTIMSALRHEIKVPGRFHKYTFGARKEHTVIDDSYNACPESMKAALYSFERLEAPGKKIVILGDMLEMGINAPFWHRQLGRMLSKASSLHHVILVGNHVKWTSNMLAHGNRYEIHPHWHDAVAALDRLIDRDPVCVLVKGSLGMGLGNVVKELVKRHEL